MSALHLAWFRVSLGVYLAIHFAQLVPWAGELFSSQGMLADPGLNPTAAIFPNLLRVLDSPASSAVFLAALSVASVFLAAGKGRRPLALILWYGWACLWNRNFLISNPSLPFIGWLLLALVLIPAGEPTLRGLLRRGEPQQASDWSLPRPLHTGAWLLLSLGYTISGLHKLGAPSWRDGTAILRVLEIPLARPNILREWLVDSAPESVLKLMTYSSLGLEVLVLPLALWSRTRPLVWFAMVGMHLGILAVVDFADLTVGMLLMHAFTFDPRWVTRLFQSRIAPRSRVHGTT